MSDPLSTKVHARLVSDVVSLRFGPGQLLSENELAQEYGVSRTPVREAVQRLRLAGLVEVRPQSGTVVAKIDLARVREAQFVRESLELACLDLALRRGRPPGSSLRALRSEVAAQRRCAAAGDTVGFLEHDEALHRGLCALSGHQGVWDTIATSKAHLDRVRRLSLVTPAVMRSLAGQHAEVLACLAAGDRAGTLRAARAHARESLRVLPELVAAHPGYFSDPQGVAS